MKLRLNPWAGVLIISLLDRESSYFFVLLVPLFQVNSSSVRPWI